ncbi:FKBP-type peptidyl-prolyl cis-trans isomerase [Actinomyces sp. MRS3W]|uniref:FKBP-type peptidyl-prolyl cis-trans isomerase n=1 Tax=Actinomyces sp. MRS3W TaxID=2800796 RepID=UPI0028FD5FB8|nr:FKBP-type peptidyl-prolyl cis-trans isomerase [Actinomyces sp. MRS3W]MDU0348450.1 FKBP-type peptidyl-prolyl cis-trans isomerase [Actinomyces sp. MRS3W]MDU0348461.1 FKBP-type peptidyl-prolyl cis-trans isomerase [Actinomyces sp. MRS3W]
MRRAAIVLPALALTACLALTGCSDSSGKAADASASAEATVTPVSNVDCSTLTIDDDADSLPTLEGEAGTQPTITWGDGDAPTNLTVKTLTAGDGAEVDESSIVVADYAGWEWGQTEAFDSSYARGEAVPLSLGGVIPGWRCGLVGHHEGDRLELSIPAELAYGQSATEGRPSGDLVFVVEIGHVVASSAVTEAAESAAAASKDAVADTQAEQALAERGITVSGELGTAATISVTEGAAEPTEQETVVVARGAGEPVADGDYVLLHMAFVNWDDPSSLQSSWDVGAAQQMVISASSPAGALIDVPVGSRVVILIPGDESQGTVSTAFVMDIAAIL